MTDMIRATKKTQREYNALRFLSQKQISAYRSGRAFHPALAKQ
jgi:hypothetical protein